MHFNNMHLQICILIFILIFILIYISLYILINIFANALPRLPVQGAGSHSQLKTALGLSWKECNIYSASRICKALHVAYSPDAGSCLAQSSSQSATHCCGCCPCCCCCHQGPVRFGDGVV